MNFFKLFIPVFISVFLIIADYKFSYLDNLKRSIATLISPIYLVVNLPSTLYIWINEQGTSREVLLNQNKQLNNELTELKTKLQIHNALLLENEKLTKLLGASYRIKSKKFTMARISSVSQSRLKKQIIIDKGSNDGLKVGQISLGDKGIVGQITQVTPLYSTILMATDPTQHVPVQNGRNGIRGISKGLASKENKLSVNFIKSGSDVKMGDVFLSSAIGSKFPQGYPLGEVSHVETHTDESFLHIQLTPTQSIEKLEFVLIGGLN
ncbi:rod shape-determining protein MreC [Candidatus Thioglobus sp.]|jgi:rod shape-determining protein MreC|uniref:rod shape-determining protein MreC n=1 Tax=Candidatus Thioglobus sp. TaxID=2026721 RepID=UPI001772A49A|nr:rod shape-determining protein MreC [Candidatus Thioglobus sp.]